MNDPRWFRKADRQVHTLYFGGKRWTTIKGRWVREWLLGALAFSGVVAACALIICGLIGLTHLGAEKGCREKASELALPSGDFRFWSNQCYLTLPSGEVVPDENYRVTEPVAGRES